MAPSRARARLALALLPLLSGLPSAAAGEGLYLHSIPTRSDTPAPALDGPLRVRVFVARPGDLAERLPDLVRSVERDHVEIELAGYPQVEAGDPEAYRAASFLIDFDEPELAGLARELVARHGPTPSVEALRAFASAAIPTKSMDRGWDLASRVARTGEGDCTEHAVLLAALARSVGRPARVVTGVVVLESGQRLEALGHAWAEIHEKGRWAVADATPIADGAQALAYLPILAVEDEGPGYAMQLGLGMQRTWVRSLEVRAGSVPTAAP